MKGIGAAPEAFDSGPVMYDLLFDMAWEDGPVDCGQYVREYAKSRYGGSDSHLERAWDILLHTAYWKKDMYAQGAGESVINARPSETFRSASTWGHSAFEYDQKALEQALPELRPTTIIRIRKHSGTTWWMWRSRSSPTQPTAYTGR